MKPPITVDRARGLASSQVHRLAFDGLGRMWMAGPSGLACYDGHGVRTFDRRDGLECAGLRSVSVGADGTVWIGTDLGLEALSAQSQVVRWGERLPWPYGLVSDIVHRAGRLWLATAQGVVVLEVHRPGGRLRLLAHHDIGFTRDIVPCDAAAVVAVSAELGLVVVDGDGLRRLRHPDLPTAESIRHVVPAGAGRLLVGTTRGVQVADPQGRTLARIAAPEGAAEVTAMAVAAGVAHIAYGRTLVPYDLAADGALHAGTPSAFGSRINHLVGDGLGNLWIATDSSGVERHSCLRHAIEPIDLGHAAAVYAIKPQDDGRRMHIGGDGFAVDLAVDPSRRVQASRLVELPSTVWDSLPDTVGGGRWLAAHAGLFRQNAEGAIERVGGSDGRLAAPCRVLLQRADGLWVGTLGGLLRWQGGQVTEVTGHDGTSLGYVYTLALDADGRLWVGTLGRGLWHETAAGLEPVVGGPLSANGNTCVVLASPSGRRRLVLQDERVIMLDGDAPPRQIGSEHPVAGWSALWVDEHRLAIGSSDGLRLVDADGGDVVQRINALYGASAWEFTNNRTLVRGADDRLYCGLSAGLFAVDLSALQRFRAPPQVRLADLHWHGTEPQRDGDAVRVEPGKWSVEVRVFTAWLVDEAQVRLRFRLVGFEADWSALTAQPSVHFNSLPPGRYMLQAQAFAPLAGFGEATTVLTIEVAARTWQALMGGIAAWYDDKVGRALRNRLMLERHRRLEAEIEERVRDLARANEELERRRAAMELTARTDGLTGWANRRDFDERFAIEAQRAARSSAPLGLLLVDVDHFKRYNDRYGHPAGDDCLRQVTGAMQAHLRPYDVAARYGGEEFAVVLPGATAETVRRIGERLCDTVQALALPHADSSEGVVTVSVGGVSAVGGAPAELLRHADLALYAAKASGRNRFVAHDAHA